MKIQGVDTVELLNSKLLGLLPGLECLARLHRQSSGNFIELAESYKKIRTTVSQLGIAALSALFIWVLAQDVLTKTGSASAAFLFGSLSFAIFCALLITHYDALKIFTFSVNHILEITDHYRTGKPNAIVQFATLHMVEDAIRTTLIVIAKNVLQATPDSDTNRGTLRDFKTLHKSAEAIGFELGPYELFFNPARELILQEQTARAAEEAAATPPSALS